MRKARSRRLYIVCYFYVSHRGRECGIFASIFQKETVKGNKLKTTKIGYVEKGRE